MAFLVGIDGALAGRRYAVEAACLIGRGPFSQVVINEPQVSRQHAKVVPDGEALWLYDLQSVNGTFVNGIPVRRRRLEVGDLLRVGKTTLRYVDESGPRPPMPVERDEFSETPTIASGNTPTAVPTPSRGTQQIEGPDTAIDFQARLHRVGVLMQSLADTQDVYDLLGRIAVGALELSPAARAVAVLLRDENGILQPRMVLPRPDRTMVPIPPAAVLEQIAATPRAQLVPAENGEVLLIAPMVFRGISHGVIELVSRADRRFADGDRTLIGGIAAQAAMALNESVKQERMRQDLHLAQQIQQSFLPRQLPLVEGIDFIAEYRPAHSVGGDFYDVFWLDEQRIGLFIGDVSGKGIAAALLMARISSELRIAALAEQEPRKVLTRVNQALLERKQYEFFVTGVYATLDVATHEVWLANAGHLPPFIRRRAGTGQESIERIDEGAAAAIGIFDDAEYHQVKLQLRGGDSLLLCTDGVIEATDCAGAQFGFERLAASLGEGSSRAGEVVDRLLAQVRSHVGDAAQYDDLTLVVCGITEGARGERFRHTEPSRGPLPRAETRPAR